ncbi:MAG TPA: serine hydrolase domain-containing protein, partial [Burkholderiaceae bacterium]
MKHLHFGALAAGLLILALASAGLARADDSPAAIQKILQERIDIGKKATGVVVGMVDAKGPRVTSYGAVAAGGAPVDGDTVFEIGSVSKTFTATLLADMVQRGEVALDDPISKYLPASVKTPKRDGKEITLLDLATQTSGLPRMPSNFAPKDKQNPYADYTAEQMYAFLSSFELTRDIGSKYEYSNLGVGLLGHILALRAGTDYATLVQQRITGPLGMASTAIVLTPAMQTRLAAGHNRTLARVPGWDMNVLAGAGAIRSTVNDMLKYAAANLGLPPAGAKADAKLSAA